MSLISNVANYGGKISTSGDTKQFIMSDLNLANWIYKKISGKLFQTTEKYNIPVIITGDLTVSGSIFNPSDKQLKNNINNINNQITDDLMTLNPIIFSYKNDINCKIHYGLLAQEVEEKFPNLVEDNLYTGFKSVNYQELIPIMLEKMKNMQNEINYLKSKINN